MKKVLLGMLVLGAMASCKKDKKNCDLNTANIQGSYKVTASTSKAAGSNTIVDEFATWDACEKDDLTILNAGGTATYTDAGTQCSPANNDTGIWSLSGSVLTVDGQAYSVTSFDCGGATLTYTDSFGDTYTTTIVKQ